MNTVYLGLGSNLGQRDTHIERALDQLSAHDDIIIQQLAARYETVAIASYQQPNYLNTAVKIITVLTPLELLDVTEAIELAMGRTSKGMGDPRVIDIDILFYNDQVLSHDRLMIPHPLAHERLFVLNPLHDIAPDLVHPMLNMTISELRSQLDGY
ncbi:MAG: 2-amino-4-hydroxy-6-hydroxymethyldihydropteridine diphosphokinase [Candidatus Marinamargulisbacteria bacterium]